MTAYTITNSPLTPSYAVQLVAGASIGKKDAPVSGTFSKQQINSGVAWFVLLSGMLLSAWGMFSSYNIFIELSGVILNALSGVSSSCTPENTQLTSSCLQAAASLSSASGSLLASYTWLNGKRSPQLFGFIVGAGIFVAVACLSLDPMYIGLSQYL